MINLRARCPMSDIVGDPTMRASVSASSDRRALLEHALMDRVRRWRRMPDVTFKQTRPHAMRHNTADPFGAGRDWISCKRRSRSPILGQPSNPHPPSELWRSECDPIRIRPRPLHLKAEQRDQIVPDDDRDVSFAGFILGQLLGPHWHPHIGLWSGSNVSFRRKTSHHRKGRGRQASTAVLLRRQPRARHRSNGCRRDR